MTQGESLITRRRLSGVAILAALAAAACSPAPPTTPPPAAEPPVIAPTSAEQPRQQPAPRKAQVEVSEQILIEPIRSDWGDPTQAMQSGGSDLCDPSADPEARRRAGIDCEAITAEEKRAAQAATPPSTPQDPLLRPGSREQRAFESLDLGEGVPSTVILNR